MTFTGKEQKKIMSSIDKIPEHLRGILQAIGMLYEESNFPGKVHHERTASLDVKFSAGCMVNFDRWVSADQHNDYFGKTVLAAYNTMMVKIMLDDKVIYNKPMGNEVVDFHYDFSDNAEHTYNLKIIVDGPFNKLSKQYKDHGFVSHMLKIHDVHIENLSMSKLLEGQGFCFFDDAPATKNVWANLMGKPGCQQFEFSTPIYTWLLSSIDS